MYRFGSPSLLTPVLHGRSARKVIAMGDPRASEGLDYRRAGGS